MKRITRIALAGAAALSLGLAAATVSASPFGYGPGYYGMGPGMMYGYGPGYGMGWGGHMGGYYGMGPGMMHGYGGGYYGMGPGMMYGYGPQAAFGSYFGNVEQNLSTLKSQLGITKAQEGAWQDFVNTAKQQSASRQAWFEKMQQARASGSAQDFYAQQNEFFKQRQADFEASGKALNTLYAALTPEQKQLADQSFGGYGPAYCLQGFGANFN